MILNEVSISDLNSLTISNLDTMEISLDVTVTPSVLSSAFAILSPSAEVNGTIISIDFPLTSRFIAQTPRYPFGFELISHASDTQVLTTYGNLIIFVTVSDGANQSHSSPELTIVDTYISGNVAVSWGIATTSYVSFTATADDVTVPAEIPGEPDTTRPAAFTPWIFNYAGVDQVAPFDEDVELEGFGDLSIPGVVVDNNRSLVFTAVHYEGGEFVHSANDITAVDHGYNTNDPLTLFVQYRDHQPAGSMTIQSGTNPLTAPASWSSVSLVFKASVPDVTITPDAVVVPSSLIAPTVTTQQSITPTALSASTLIIDPTVKYDFVVMPNVFDVHTSFTGHAVVSHGLATAGVLGVVSHVNDVIIPTVSIGSPVSVVSSVIAPSISVGSGIRPNVMSIHSSTLAPTVAEDYKVAVNAVTSTFTVRSPTIGGFAHVSASVFQVQSSIIAPSLIRDYVNVAASLTANVSLAAPIVSASGNFPVSQIQLQSSVVNPTLHLDAVNTPAKLNLTGSMIAPTIGTGWSVLPNVFVGTVNLQSAVVTGAANISASMFTFSSSLLASTVTTSQVMKPSALLLQASIVAPVVTATGNVSIAASSFVANVSLNGVTAKTSSLIPTSNVQSTFSIVSPTIHSYVTVTPGLLVISSNLLQPDVVAQFMGLLMLRRKN